MSKTPKLKYQSPSDTWLISSHVTLVEAILLTLNIEPQDLSHLVLEIPSIERPASYLATQRVLISALKHGLLEGRLEAKDGVEVIQREFLNDDEIDFISSFVMLRSLRRFVTEEKLTHGILKMSDLSDLGFDDPRHSRYAPKLAAAVEAWKHCGVPKAGEGRPRQRIEKWLRANKDKFGAKPDEKLSDNAIISIATIANWEPNGGNTKKDLRLSADNKEKPKEQGSKAI